MLKVFFNVNICVLIKSDRILSLSNVADTFWNIKFFGEAEGDRDYIPLALASLKWRSCIRYIKYYEKWLSNTNTLFHWPLRSITKDCNDEPLFYESDKQYWCITDLENAIYNLWQPYFLCQACRIVKIECVCPPPPT